MTSSNRASLAPKSVAQIADDRYWIAEDSHSLVDIAERRKLIRSSRTRETLREHGGNSYP